MTEMNFQRDIIYIYYTLKDWTMSETLRPKQLLASGYFCKVMASYFLKYGRKTNTVIIWVERDNA